MNRINDWEIMGPMGGEFEAETDFSDWLKDLHKTSITELDIVGLHDTTTGEDRKFVAIDKVLEIIDRHEPKESYYGFNEYEAAYIEGKEAAIEALKEEILALKGGE